MTSDAGRILMRAFEREFRRGVIEAAKFFPIPRVVAGFAGLFSGMRIGVAPGTRLIAEMILACSGGRGPANVSRIDIVYVEQRLMTVGAQYRGVSIDQSEFCLCVARQVECGGPEGVLCMTQFAAIFVRR